MSTHYTDGRRWSHISNAWILVEGWNDKEEIASLKAQLAYALDRVCPHCANKDDSTFVVECAGCRARHAAALSTEANAPEGWRLVPHEPTAEMLAAGREQWHRVGSTADAWMAMWQAAPEPADAA